MRHAAFAAIVLAAMPIAAAQAKPQDGPDWFRRTQAWVDSLLGERPADHEIIAPPANIDPEMVLVPPTARGTMRIIRPRNRGP